MRDSSLRWPHGRVLARLHDLHDQADRATCSRARCGSTVTSRSRSSRRARPPERTSRRNSLRLTAASAPAGVDLLFARDKWSIERLLRAYEPDLTVCWGFPWKLPQAALDVARLGSINQHPALLPRHRGPIPFAWTLRDGDTDWGFTWHRMDAELDTGNILAQGSNPVRDDDCDIAEFGPRLLEQAIALLPQALERVAAGDPGRPAAGRGRDLGRPLRGRRLRAHRLVAAGPPDPQPGARLAADVRASRSCARRWRRSTARRSWCCRRG